MDLSKIKLEYMQEELNISDLDKNPIEQFKKWMAQVIKLEISYPNAACLGSSSPRGMPDLRTVLIKEVSDKGFKLYTNYDSKKAHDFDANPQASLLFYWKELDRQVRIQGSIEKLSREESVAYFDSRPYESRVSAIISEQSREVSKVDLYQEYETLKAKNENLVCPDNWGGYIVVPAYFEFWQGRPNRLHDRFAYTAVKKDQWDIKRLAP